MKKKLLSGIFALALLVATGYGVDKSVKSETDLSNLALANVEALANGEIIIGPACVNDCEYCHCYYPPIPEDPVGYWAEGREYN